MVLNKTKPRRIQDIPFPVSTIETIDLALHKFVNETLDIRCITSTGFKKVPVLWTSAERNFQSKNLDIRDAEGALKLPLITIERTSVTKDPSRKGTVYANIPATDKVRGGSIAVSRQINQSKTSNFANVGAQKRRGQLNFPVRNQKIVYRTISIPMPVYVVVNYEITLRTEYQQQMNQVVTPFITRPGGINYIIIEEGRLRYEGFIQDDFSQSNNISSFSNEERKFETKINIEVLGWLTGEDKNRLQPNLSISENAVEIKIPRERIVLRDELERESARLYGLEGIALDAARFLDDKIAQHAPVRNPGAVTTSEGVASSGAGGGGGGGGVSSSDAVTKNNYKVAQAATETADGSRTQFTVPENFVAGTLMVFNQGILMRVGADNDFTLSGRVVTFEEAPANGANVLFSYVAE